MQQKIDEIKNNFFEEIKNIKELASLEEFRIKYLSKNGLVTKLFDEFRELSKEEKPKFGQVINKVKNEVQDAFNELKTILEADNKSFENYIDLTLPGREKVVGTKHILTQTLDEMKSIFIQLGFSVHEGPELESDYNNFEALNFPDDHPVRDMQDTFFVNDKMWYDRLV